MAIEQHDSPDVDGATILQQQPHIVQARSIIDNPSHDELRRLTAEMPSARPTACRNVDVFTKVDSRSAASTYIVTDDPKPYRGHQTMTRAVYEGICRMQNDYMREQEMIVIDGYISNAPEVQTPARLVIERANANIAGMQKFLYFTRRDGDPQVTVIYTPNLPAPGYPNDRCIAVDLENGVTRVLNSDYFGESKKGGLRMWNKIVYDKGGLPMHAGCKVVPTGNGHKTIVVIGLSGTGKTTTTFRRQGDSRAVQDDFIALMPGGTVHGTESGCFAKTFALSPEHEPEIYAAVTSPVAYLENVFLNEDGSLDLNNESFTQNGRAVFPLEALGRYEDAQNIGPVDIIVILNRARSVIPAIARLSLHQAAAYFMLGETQGTSAGGKDEAGKSLRVPGTNPFFPLRLELQANRFLQLLRTRPIDVYLMNTGWIVDDHGPDSKKITVAHSSACVKAIAEGGLEWVKDADFGYEMPVSVPGIVPEDEDMLNPRTRFEATGRLADYKAWVQKLNTERKAFLQGFPDLDPYILTGI
jgi:phosphoenolpyruvate carboxykinase (ATP)